MKPNRLCVLVAFLLALGWTVNSAEGSAFRVLVNAEGKEVARGVGVLVADGLVLTAAGLIDQGDQILIEDPSTGARYIASIRARSTSLALLSVPGLTGNPADIAAQAPEIGHSVHLLLPDSSLRAGILHAMAPPDSIAAGSYSFTISVSDDEAGSPLMNNCGHLLAVATGRFDSDAGTATVSVGVGGTHPELVAFLAQDSVSYQTANTPCLSVEEQLAQAEAASAALEEERRSLEEQLQSLEDSSSAELQLSAERLAALAAQRTALESRLSETSVRLARQDSIVAEKLGLQTALDSLREQHELAQSQIQAQSTQARQRLYLVGGVGAVVLLVLALLLWSSWRRRRDTQDELHETDARLREAEAAAARRSATFPDILLLGRGPKGEEIRIKVDGSALAQSESGVVIGRSSVKASYVLIDGSVSRSHALIRLVDGSVAIEDLGSLNGTVVDGIKLTPGQSRPLPDGAAISLGDVDLTVTFLQA